MRTFQNLRYDIVFAIFPRPTFVGRIVNLCLPPVTIMKYSAVDFLGRSKQSLKYKRYSRRLGVTAAFTVQLVIEFISVVGFSCFSQYKKWNISQIWLFLNMIRKKYNIWSTNMKYKKKTFSTYNINKGRLVYSLFYLPAYSLGDKCDTICEKGR